MKISLTLLMLFFFTRVFTQEDSYSHYIKVNFLYGSKSCRSLGRFDDRSK